MICATSRCGLDGFQTAELIKKLERTRHIPIVFLTAISKDAENVFQGYGAGGSTI